MSKFRFRRSRHHSHGSRRLHPLIWVAICLGVTVIVALVIGNILHYRLDDEALQKLTDGEASTEAETNTLSARTVPKAKLYPFSLGDSTADLFPNDILPPSALSVSINTPNGELLYVSPVSDHQGISAANGVSLSESMTEVRMVVPYLCGVFYPQALQMQSTDLIYAAMAEEAALLREFASAGASEILLVGLPMDAANRSASLFYAEQMRAFLPSSVSIGLAVSYNDAMYSPELLPYLKSHADYLAIDLQGQAEDAAATVLSNTNYFLIQHEMRLLLASDQTAYISIAEATLTDFAILQAPPKEALPPEEVSGE